MQSKTIEDMDHAKPLIVNQSQFKKKRQQKSKKNTLSGPGQQTKSTNNFLPGFFDNIIL